MKRHLIFTLLGLVACCAAAGATEVVYVPSLPSAPIVPGIKIPSLPSRIDMIIPGQVPTRNLPAYIRQNPAALPAPAIPGPRPVRISLPGARKTGRVSLPSAARGAFRMVAASRGRALSPRVLDKAFDHRSQKTQEPSLVEDDEAVVPYAPRGDSSHLTIPESDLEREIGIR